MEQQPARRGPGAARAPCRGPAWPPSTRSPECRSPGTPAATRSARRCTRVLRDRRRAVDRLDTDWIGDFTLPAARRSPSSPTTAATTPASTHTGICPAPSTSAVRKSTAPTNVLYRVDAGGPAIQALDGGPDWAATTATRARTATPAATRPTGAPAPPLLHRAGVDADARSSTASGGAVATTRR